MKVDLTIDRARGIHRTDIEWADYSANPIRAVDRKTGEVGWACVKVSSGCARCYAEAINKRFGTRRPFTRAGLDGVDLVLDEGVLLKMQTFRPRGPFKSPDARPKVFMGDMCDLFMDGVEDEHLDRIIAVCASRPDVDWLFLTKRPERALAWQQASGEPYPPNVWIGTSVEDQSAANLRIPVLTLIDASVLFLSCEPLLGLVDLGLRRDVLTDLLDADPDRGTAFRGRYPFPALPDDARTKRHDWIDWVIVGGESGPGARACDVGAVEGVVNMCGVRGVPVFVKQLGSRPVQVNYGDGRELLPMPFGYDGGEEVERWYRPLDPKGGDMAEWPESLRVRQWPVGVGKA